MSLRIATPPRVSFVPAQARGICNSKAPPLASTSFTPGTSLDSGVRPKPLNLRSESFGSPEGRTRRMWSAWKGRKRVEPVLFWPNGTRPAPLGPEEVATMRRGLEVSGSFPRRKVRVSAPGPATSSRGREARAQETSVTKKKKEPAHRENLKKPLQAGKLNRTISADLWRRAGAGERRNAYWEE